MATVLVLPEAAEERRMLPAAEQVALDRAFDKLRSAGVTLPFPHQSQIKGAQDLRELRPRAGRSRWRAFYRRTGQDTFVVAALGPEAAVDPGGFKRAVAAAEVRLTALQGSSS